MLCTKFCVFKMSFFFFFKEQQATIKQCCSTVQGGLRFTFVILKFPNGISLYHTLCLATEYLLVLMFNLFFRSSSYLGLSFPVLPLEATGILRASALPLYLRPRRWLLAVSLVPTLSKEPL